MMQPRNAFRPCPRCGVRIAHDLLTGDSMEFAGEEYGGRPLYRWHRCPGKLSREAQKIARNLRAAEIALRYPRLPEGRKLKTDDVAPGGPK
jgi:hypothetical protein